MKHIPALLGCLLLALTGRAQTTATNVRFRTEPSVRKVIIEYELPQMLATDSVYLELETASGRVIRPISVNGDVGKAIKPGKNKLIAWDVVRDNVRLDEDVKVLLRVARVVGVASPATAVAARPGVAVKPISSAATAVPARVAAPAMAVRRPGPVVPIIGWTATAGLATYATILMLKGNKDTKEYNDAPRTVPRDKIAYYRDLSDRIDKNQKTFTVVAAAAGVLAIANVVYLIVRKPAKARTSLIILPGTQVASLGISHRF